MTPTVKWPENFVLPRAEQMASKTCETKKGGMDASREMTVSLRVTWGMQRTAGPGSFPLQCAPSQSSDYLS